MQRLQAQKLYERALNQISQARRALAAGPRFRKRPASIPGWRSNHDTLGMLLLDLGRMDQAVAELKRAVDLDPHRGDTYFHLGTALAEARRWDGAVAAYRKAIRPTVPDRDGTTPIRIWVWPCSISAASARPRTRCASPSASTPTSRRPTTISGWY